MNHTAIPIAAATRRPEAHALRAGATLKRQRLELGLNQADFAKRLGMTRVDYEALERGDLMSSIPAAKRVA
jgi:transcriptional regulator with XRE-family HTH domain